LPDQLRSVAGFDATSEHRARREQEVATTVVLEVVDDVCEPDEIARPRSWHVDLAEKLPARVSDRGAEILCAGTGRWIAEHNVGMQIQIVVICEAVAECDFTVEVAKQKSGYGHPPGALVDLLAVKLHRRWTGRVRGIDQELAGSDGGIQDGPDGLGEVGQQ
jgi:hypothetical protein